MSGRKRGRGRWLAIRIRRKGDVEPRLIFLSAKRVLAYQILALGFGLALIAMVASWGALAHRAATADDLEREVAALRARNDSIEDFVGVLAELEARQDRVRRLFGSNEFDDSRLWLPRPGGAGRRVRGPTAADTVTSPTMWPLTESGFVTQSLLDGARGDHPGVDIAVSSGSYIRAAGGGEVIEAARHPVYGLFILIDHGDSHQTRYGHASYLAVERGQVVRQGEVIALTGSTGRSTAPHLHFEILRNGRPIDPLSMVSPPGAR
ncbi:MAG: peptidoglycan DD-metalloendopeptidase family protein [Gemmatimonadetes bacterium]|nr:M23 family metallopeptidase [Gemmatimonadota bacterium]MDE2677149.1 M23 family metallopeptidase [Gemmatimonadota bacterium]MXX33680.1 peptidoglycan DD-metalloendopeptidase family protein [Gemmatimonadota bacterium]MYA10102.1 peptidoglycan DD-metalloendopeptidase family protein [Gemmatimonadota bacterium]MYD14100.1 peptidoglycan DD-metalloendopeptidase family protein [Gemmatimonadota bacterium]